MTRARHPTDGHVAALAALDGVGPARLRWLLSIGDPREVWQRIGTGSLEPTDSEAVRLERGTLGRWRSEVSANPGLPVEMLARLDRYGVEVLRRATIDDLFGVDPDPPPVLFSRGVALPARAARVAIVGTRRASNHGLRFARALGRDLAAGGVAVVSGLALGIDAAAHRGALEGRLPSGDPTATAAASVIGVIGAGHDRPCPRANLHLAAQVLDSGALLSEVPPGVSSAPWRYPVRNRLIAALAQVVVVVESAASGGSMSTVAEALVRDRAVMAVPGPVGPRSSEGCHGLLRDGAQICTGALDVFTLLGLTHATSVSIHGAGPDGIATPPLPELQQRVLDALAGGPLSIDAVVDRSGVRVGSVASVLAELEGLGLLRRRGGWIELC